jgi:hypothetical protein
VQVPIPSTTSEDAHRVSARCHGKFVGAQLIEVVDNYPTQFSLLTTDRTAVPAGQAITVSGTKLHVLEATEPAAHTAFGPSPLGDLPLWANLFAGIAVLVTSVGLSTRRRP